MTTDTTNENRRKDDAHPAGALSWPTDVMIDVETLGLTPGSAILSIGAVMFGPEGLGDEFYAPIALTSCTAAGLTMDPGTVAWWMKQSDAARAAAFRDDAETLPAVLAQFTCWFELVDAQKPWCHGANFDAPLLEAAYRACGMTPPWKFWNVRDTRTLYELADVKVDRARGTHHNALDDARAQAEAAVVALQRLRDAREPSAADAKDAERVKALETEIERYKRAGFSMSQTIHNITVGNQAAWIEWQHGGGAEAAMAWIHNGLVGPGLIPDEEEPHGKDAQAYADANGDHRTYDQAIAARQKDDTNRSET